MTRLGLLALGLLLLLAPAAHADSFLHSGECESGAISFHAWHEIGHDLATLAVGERPLNPGAMWGDKWGDAQIRYRRIALGGLVMQLIVAAIDVAMEEPPRRCALHMNTIGSGAYALRARLGPEFSGDYDPFSPGRRNTIALTTVVGGLMMEALADVPATGRSLFAGLPAGVMLNGPVPLGGQIAGDAPVKRSAFADRAAPEFPSFAGLPLVELDATAVAGTEEDESPAAMINVIWRQPPLR